ncbi:MAG: FG-GAP-like repeat-containing protein [Chloroflexota bacterium]
MSKRHYLVPRLLLVLLMVAGLYGGHGASMMPAVAASQLEGVSIVADWTAMGDQSQSYLGHALASAGDVNGDGFDDVIIGGYGFTQMAGVGLVQVYYGSTTGLPDSPSWTATGSSADNWFGYSVSTAGDVDGDGFNDVIVGAPSNGAQSGSTFVWLGSPTGLNPDSPPDWATSSISPTYGLSVGTAGDVNGDGYSDVVVGAPGTMTDTIGLVYVYYGSPGGLSSTPDWTVRGEQADDGFGASVGTAGDVNDDSYADVIVGAPYFDDNQADQGRAYVYQGSAISLTLMITLSAEGSQAGANFGYAAGTAGDVNGDGYSEVIVGAPGYPSQPGLATGGVFVFPGSAAGPDQTQVWTGGGDQGGEKVGWSVGAAGDLNGDGLADVVAGAPGYNSNQGRALVWYGSASGVNGNVAGDPANAPWIGSDQNGQSGDEFGVAVGTAGRTNDDNYADVMVGAGLYGAADEGQAYLYNGGANAILALYVLAFDNAETSSVNLASYYPEVMAGIVGTTESYPNKEAVVLVDLDGDGDTFIVYVHDGREVPILGLPDAMGNFSELREYDTTDGDTLGGFIKWALATYADETEMTILSYVGHGGPLVPAGFNDYLDEHGLSGQPTERGIPLPSHLGVDPGFTDVHTGVALTEGHIISPFELATAIDQGTGGSGLDVLDVLHCFAASIEELYELAPYAEAMAASPNYTFFEPSMLGAALAAAVPGNAAPIVAAQMVAAYHNSLVALGNEGADHPHLLIAVDSNQVQAIKVAWDAVADYLLAQPAADLYNKVLHAYQNTARNRYYDTTFCQTDWPLAPPDALSDLLAFTEALAEEWPDLGDDVDSVSKAVDEAVVVRYHTNGIPWFAEGEESAYWQFEGDDGIPLFGIALYTDFQITMTQEGIDYVNYQAAWYTDNDNTDGVTLHNEHPFGFLFGNSGWDEVFLRFWNYWMDYVPDHNPLGTAACLPIIPPVPSCGEVAAESIVSPVAGTLVEGTPVTFSVAVAVEGTVLNPLVNFRVEQGGAPVFDHTVGTGSLRNGTYQIDAAESWIPGPGDFTLTVTVDSDDRVKETNNGDNSLAQSYSVALLDPPPAITAASLAGDAVYTTGRDITLELEYTAEPDLITAQVYQFALNSETSTYEPYLLDELRCPPPDVTTECELELPEAVEAGQVILHLWGYFDGRLTSSLATVAFNYAPAPTAIGSGELHYYQVTAGRGDKIGLYLDERSQDTDLSVWYPNGYGWPSWAAGAGELLEIAAPQDGSYLIAVQGGSNATGYRLTFGLNQGAGMPGGSPMAQADGRIRRPLFLPVVPAPPPDPDLIYFSATTDGTVDGIGYADEDILLFDPRSAAYSLYFDGSANGLSEDMDVDAFTILTDTTILMSFVTDTLDFPGLGVVDDSDVVEFNPTTGAFEMYFDGSDVGLGEMDEAADVDAIDFTPEGDLVISVLGDAEGLPVQDEDLLSFTAISFGEVTSGTLSLYFDGTGKGLADDTEDVTGVWIEASTGEIYLTTEGPFSVGDLSGDGNDIFICAPHGVACAFSLYWDGDANGLGEDVVLDGLDIARPDE